MDACLQERGREGDSKKDEKKNMCETKTQNPTLGSCCFVRCLPALTASAHTLSPLRSSNIQTFAPPCLLWPFWSLFLFPTLLVPGEHDVADVDQAVARLGGGEPQHGVNSPLRKGSENRGWRGGGGGGYVCCRKVGVVEMRDAECSCLSCRKRDVSKEHRELRHNTTHNSD